MTACLAIDPDYLDDVALVRALADADRHAPAALWRRYKAMVFGTLRRVLGPDPETEDLAQEVFITVCRRASTIRNGEALRAFVAKVTVCTAHHAIRKRRVRARWLRQEIAESQNDVVLVATSRIESREAIPRLYRIVDRLRPQERTAFVLHYVDELTTAEVKKEMNVSLATAKRRISRAAQRVALHVARDPVLREYRALPARA